MAHTCPDCGMQCYCNGDIDDCCFDSEEDVLACTHCPCGLDDESDYDEYDYSEAVSEEGDHE